MSRCREFVLKTADPTQGRGSDPGEVCRAGEADVGCRIERGDRRGQTGRAGQTATWTRVRLRMGLEEVRAELETAEDGRRRALEGEGQAAPADAEGDAGLRQLAEGIIQAPGRDPQHVPDLRAPGGQHEAVRGVWRMTEAQEVRARAKALRERREELERPWRGLRGPGARPCGWSWPG